MISSRGVMRKNHRNDSWGGFLKSRNGGLVLVVVSAIISLVVVGHSLVTWRKESYQTDSRLSEIFLKEKYNDDNPFTGGGMSPEEQEVLTRLYAASNSVFEWGIGSSTIIAAQVGVERLTGVDSALPWVKEVRERVPSKYNISYVNIGEVKKWGRPVNETHRDLWPDYALEVEKEQEPFDLYLVDGRFRVACAASALLHGGQKDSRVLVHDFERESYQVLLKVADNIEQQGKLAVLHRKATASDDELISLRLKYKFDLD